MAEDYSGITESCGEARAKDVRGEGMREDEKKKKKSKVKSMREKIQDHRCKDKRRTSGNNGALFSGGVQVIVVGVLIPASSTRVHQPQIQNNMKAAPPSGSVMY